MNDGASDIADLNVGAAMTQYTQTQILVSVGTSVLAQMNGASQSIAAELVASL